MARDFRTNTSRRVEETLASSSSSSSSSLSQRTSTTNSSTARYARKSIEQWVVSAPSRSNTISAKVGPCSKSGKGGKIGSWMLRSILIVLVLVLPRVTALPSGVQNVRRFVGVETGFSISVPEPTHPYQQSESRFADPATQPRYLDTSGSTFLKEKRRANSASQGIMRQSGWTRDSVFPTVAPINSTSINTNATSMISPLSNSDQTLTVVFEASNSTTETNLTLPSPPGRRWGQTATYLPAHNVVLVVGGQTSLSGAITNDVFALDVADLSAESVSSNSTAQSWVRLSSEGLPAHAYASATVMVSPNSGEEKLWIVGGITQNCARDAPAYVWSAPVGNMLTGKWEAVYTDDGTTPIRRKGAKAVSVPSANGTSVMVSGGTFDQTTCAETNGTYGGIDMWSGSSSSSSISVTSPISTTAHVGIDMTSTTFAAVSSLALDPRMRDFSLVDYTTALLPPTPTCNSSRIIFLGGKTKSGTLAPLSRFWALDLSTGDWEHWNATGLIPSPRMGHTAVVTSDGKVIIHGGYLEDPAEFTVDNDPVSEVFILDTQKMPARWSAASWTSESTRPPAVAYHSAVMSGQVMMTSFGKVSGGPVGSYAGQSFLQSSSGSGMVHYMDTATLSDAGGLTWSSSIAGVAQARQAISAATSAAAPVASVQASPATSAAPVQQAPAQASPAATAPSGDSKPDAAAPAPVKDSTASESDPSPTTDPAPAAAASSAAQPSSNHTGAIAGGLLGAAAIAAALGGIYAWRKRKEADAYNLGKSESAIGNGNSTSEVDLAKFHDGDEEKGPYVSKLYLRPDQVAAVGAGAAVAGGWGARLKRVASTLTKTNSRGAAVEGEDRYTVAPVKPITTLRNGAPRGTQACWNGKLPEDFIASLAEDDSPFVTLPLSRGELLRPNSEGELELKHGNASQASLATVSSLKAASHFSYPYLSGMHRTTPSLHSDSRVRVILGTPEHEFNLSPGDVVSPYHLPHNPHTSPESLFLNFNHDHEDEEDLDTTVSMHGASEVNTVKTPMFPWDTPVITAPEPAARNVSMLRARPSGLRVTNAA
ncbi:uncharacterized protein MEPE_00796 [Melanopsichium pennsylvanicum]|uniref:Galactose oxidase n=2 Tax=Melanopsichium pennsylvanicum TaxID=63383 RepID=A0AAJ4XHA3_9BASI|nr:putative protein [Melanopsichium pennsylvanicum 4]SNX82090.1 uncharacterized protein MEPE_00796 [Melanopsichium pennsylvanicum]